MVKIDLITGFLGAGKTTFLRKYVTYLKNKGENICILENDYGAINIDMMLILDLGVDSEMVAGGCDYDCHKRRFKTKLISMAMRGYTRIIVEPSGVYDTDEFFDTLNEEPLDSMYEIGNVISIVDSTINNLSLESKYFLTSQIAVSGAIVLSKTDLKESNKDRTISLINDALKENGCDRKVDNIIYDSNDLDKLINAGYNEYPYNKLNMIDDNNYESLYFMELKFKREELLKLKDILFDKKYGNVIRIKGYFKENGKWYNINVNRNIAEISKVNDGQDVVIIIGENLNKELINKEIEGKCFLC